MRDRRGLLRERFDFDFDFERFDFARFGAARRAALRGLFVRARVRAAFLPAADLARAFARFAACAFLMLRRAAAFCFALVFRFAILGVFRDEEGELFVFDLTALFVTDALEDSFARLRRGVKPPRRASS